MNKITTKHKTFSQDNKYRQIYTLLFSIDTAVLF